MPQKPLLPQPHKAMLPRDWKIIGFFFRNNFRNNSKLFAQNLKGWLPNAKLKHLQKDKSDLGAT